MPPKPNQEVQEPPEDVTHAYTLQHDKKGLDPSYRGPFKIKKLVSRSTLRLIVGHYANGSERYEDRHWSELKAVKLPENVQEDSRAKLGRPSKTENSTPVSSEQSDFPSKSTGPPPTQPFTGFKPEEIKQKPPIITQKMFDECEWDKVFKTVSSNDFSKPPPSLKPWSANKSDLEAINKSINTRQL